MEFSYARIKYRYLLPITWNSNDTRSFPLIPDKPSFGEIHVILGWDHQDRHGVFDDGWTIDTVPYLQ